MSGDVEAPAGGKEALEIRPAHRKEPEESHRGIDEKTATVSNEKEGAVSVESQEEDEPEYVKGHPIIRNGKRTASY